MKTLARTIARGFSHERFRVGQAVGVLLLAVTAPLLAQGLTVIRVGTLIDGTGGVLRSATVVVEEGKMREVLTFPWLLHDRRTYQ